MNQTSSWHEQLILQLITIAVIGNGLVIITLTLLAQFHMHSIHAIDDTIVSLPLISGLTLVYLGSLLHRRKKAAWAVVVPLYTFILGFNVTQYLNNESLHHPWVFIRSIFLPLAVVSALIVFRQVFTVKSAIQNFSISLRIIVAMLFVILAYGTAGYLLLDEHDFHQELSVTQAVHHTVDQFDFTTNQELTPYTKKATVFIDSLNVLSAVAVGYIIISLFQPIRAKLTSQTHNREALIELLNHHSDDSEDFFKVWPHDKSYFGLDDNRYHAMLAYRVQRGVALVVGDPVGPKPACKRLMGEFDELCRVNDWLPAYIHVSDGTLPLYEARGFMSQKIGEEAIVDTATFLENTSHNKYFRQIRNKFEKQGYTWELLSPPHKAAVVARVHEVSDDWLTLPGRQERGFMMGYFSEEYMQEGNLLVARDAAGTIQAFINQIPTYQAEEANFDLLRHTKKALGNVNDYLLMAFIESVHQQGFQRLNMGLCPLSGLDKASSDNKSVIDSVMRFVYANGDRFYSFSGLHRFKSKYEPTWTNRYIAYRGGVRGFSRSLYALNKAMNRTK